jgi:hypothetical protein
MAPLQIGVAFQRDPYCNDLSGLFLGIASGPYSAEDCPAGKREKSYAPRNLPVSVPVVSGTPFAVGAVAAASAINLPNVPVVLRRYPNMRRPQILNGLLAVVFCLWLGYGVACATVLFEREAQAAPAVLPNNTCQAPPPGSLCVPSGSCFTCGGTNWSCQQATGNCTLGPKGCSGPNPNGTTCICNPFSC